MKLSLSAPFIAQVSLRLLACLALPAAHALADAPGGPPPEHRPKLLERVGNFFYNVADRLERSDRPGPDQPGASHPRPLLPNKLLKGGATDDTVRNRYIAPLNPDPRLLQPAKPAPTRTLDVPSGDEGFGPSHRPAPPPDSLKPVSPQIKSTAPLPDAAASGRNQKPAEPPAADAPQAARNETTTYPVATPANRAGRVKSPYLPYTELDVVGLPPGSLAKDPVTGKIFRLP